MPATVRDILLMIRAKEDVVRSLGGISNAMRRAQSQADVASARARAAALRGQATQARLAGATVDQVNALNRSAQAWDRQARDADRANTRTQNLASSMSSLGHVAQTTGIVMAAAGAASLYGLKQAVDVASEWDKQVRLTFTQVDKRYKPSLSELSAIGQRVSRDIAVPFETIQTALFDVFSSTEANMPQAEQLLRSFARAAVAGQTDVQTASRATIGLMNSFKVPFKDVNKLLDIQFQLVQEGVGTYEEWANRIGLVSPSAARAGQSVEMMAAALATATRSGMNAARASTSVARAFDAMSNPKTEKMLKKIGVQTRDAKGNFRPLVDVLGDWRKELEKMPKEDRVKNILDTLKGAGGTIEARRFLQNVLLTKGGLELFQDQVKEFSTDKGAFERAYGDMANSAAAKSQLLHNAWMRLKLGIGEALLPAFKALVDFAQRVVNWFNELPEPVRRFIGQALALVSVLSILGGGLAIIVGALVTFAGVIAAAGTAILPVLGILVGLAAGIGVAVAMLAGFTTVMILAWQKSANFRDMLSSIWTLIVQVGGIIKNFALGVWADFNTYVMPALRNLWTIIEQQVLPRIRNFVDFWRAQVVPMLSLVAGIIRQTLVPAWIRVRDVINNDVRPALVSLIAWWDANKQYIIPVGKALLALGAIMLILAGTQIAFLIRMFALMLQQASRTAQVITAVWAWAKGQVSNSINIIKLAIQVLINWFNNLRGRVASAAGAVVLTVLSMAARIRGVFAGAASWLISAGANIVRGLVNGIRGMVGAAASAAADLAKRTKDAAMNALGISSPSRVFKDIGANVVKGFVEGVKGNRKKVIDTMFALTRDIRRSINDADIKASARRKMMTKWNARLHTTQTKLLGLEGKRAALQTKLSAATDKYNDLIKQRADLTEKVRDAMLRSSDITSLTTSEQRSTATIRTTLQKRLADAQAFAKNLRTLAARGMDKESIAQLAAQGVESAGAMVGKLANASDEDLRAITLIQQELRKLAGETSTKVAGDLYNAGIAAAQGLIKGLNSQIAAITKQMTAIAVALVKQIKKELGIRSPSKVFAAIGANTAQGYINGYKKRMDANSASLSPTYFTDDGSGRFGGNPYGGPSSGMVINKTYDIKQTINTQEIDPVKHAADLGWELTGRIN